MFPDALLYGIAIGLAIGALIFIALRSTATDPSSLRALAVASFGIGAAITWWFYRHPAAIDAAMKEITERGLAIVAAALVAALVFWRSRR